MNLKPAEAQIGRAARLFAAALVAQLVAAIIKAQAAGTRITSTQVAVHLAIAVVVAAAEVTYRRLFPVGATGPDTAVALEAHRLVPALSADEAKALIDEGIVVARREAVKVAVDLLGAVKSPAAARKAAAKAASGPAVGAVPPPAATADPAPKPESVTVTPAG